MKKSDILICVFSYNMGPTLENCLDSIAKFCDGYEIVLIDDNSTDKSTIEIIENWKHRISEVFVNREPKAGQKHGNLYGNIRQMCSHASLNGFRYLLMVQDDMQFVRPLDQETLDSYQSIFNHSEYILQVDPRFVRRGQYEVLPAIRAYKNPGITSYADVGLLDLNRLGRSGWEITDGERANRDGLAALGYERVFPFSPVIAHVPFPQRYRNGKLKRSLLLWQRGKYSFHPMTADEIASMDARPMEHPPYFRKWLRVRGMYLSRIVYWLKKDNSVLT
jgi:glycosyltransferase involved in cell wall biosynthesis